MKLFDEHVDYGLGMWRYAVWISAGAIFAMAGPVAVRLMMNVISGIGLPASAHQIILLAATVLTQFAGAIIAGAGFFGGLHRVLEDTQ